mgnify:CR=1 FL=1
MSVDWEFLRLIDPGWWGPSASQVLNGARIEAWQKCTEGRWEESPAEGVLARNKAWVVVQRVSKADILEDEAQFAVDWASGD